MDFYSSENNFLRLAHRAASLSISSDFLHTIDQVDSGLMLPATARIHPRVTSNRRMEKDPLLRGGWWGVSNKLFLLLRSHIGSQVLPTYMLVDVSSKLVQVGREAWQQICKPNLCLVPSQNRPLVFQFWSQDLQTSMLLINVSIGKPACWAQLSVQPKTLDWHLWSVPDPHLDVSLRLVERCLHPFKHSLEEFGDCISNLGRDGVAAWGGEQPINKCNTSFNLLWLLVLDLVLV